MTYETAKKLKDAGFPQTDHILDDGTCSFCVRCSYADAYTQTESIGGIAELCLPLSELIEACGEGFNNLTKGSDIGWMCNYQTDGWWETEDCPEGDTPEEAVASLFLRLNDKKQ